MKNFNVAEWLEVPEIKARVAPSHRPLLLDRAGLLNNESEALCYLMGILDAETAGAVG